MIVSLSTRLIGQACAATLLLSAAACVTTPEVRFYALNSAQTVPLAAPSSLVLAVGPIDLPRYLDRPQIVSRRGGNQLNVDEFNRWGGSLEEEVSRVLVSHIGRVLQTQRVYSYPSRIAADTDYRAALDIRAFDGEIGGVVGLDAAWSLIDDRTGKIMQTRKVSYTANAAGPGYEAYAAAMSLALGQLADELAAELGQLKAPAGGR